MSTTCVRLSALASLLVVATSSLADPPVKNAQTAALVIKDGQLVISAWNVNWRWIEKPQGTVVSINETQYLRHDQDGVIRLVDSVGDGCYWNLKLVHTEKLKVDSRGNIGENFYHQYALTPRDPKLDGWGMTFSRGVLCLQPKTESRPIFLSQFCVLTEVGETPVDPANDPCR